MKVLKDRATFLAALLVISGTVMACLGHETVGGAAIAGAVYVAKEYAQDG